MNNNIFGYAFNKGVCAYSRDEILIYFSNIFCLWLPVYAPPIAEL